MPENTEEIEKPWAVYGYFAGSNGIGKIVSKKNGSLWIKDSEGIYSQVEPWDPEWVKTFDYPIKAIAYFLVHQNRRWEYPETRGKVLERFFHRFPSQRENFDHSNGKIFSKSQ